MNLITIKTFDNVIGAHILQARLEDEGITAHIHDDNIMTMNPLLNIAVGGVKIRVDEPDVEKALKIIAEIDNAPMTNEQDETIICPKCQSTELYSDFKSINSFGSAFSWAASVMFGFLPVYKNRLYRCKKCETEFKANPSKRN